MRHNLHASSSKYQSRSMVMWLNILQNIFNEYIWNWHAVLSQKEWSLSRYMQMLILLVIGLRTMQNLIKLLQNLGQAELSHMSIVWFCGLPRCNHRLPSAQQRQILLLCHPCYEISFLWWIWQKNYMMSSNNIFFFLTLMLFAMLEDNSDALEIAKHPKMHSHTKHINICYHHFRQCIGKGEKKLHTIST